MDMEVTRRVNELLGQRLAAELEKQKHDIEVEVQRRVAEARRRMEMEMNEEFERQKQAEFKRHLEKEVRCPNFNFSLFLRLLIVRQRENIF